MVDFHTHSTLSDGHLAPAELLAQAKERGISVLALTDHDTVEGLPEARKAAEDAGIRFIPGIELNIKWTTGEFHLLGLGLGEISEELSDIIGDLQAERKRRNRTIITKLSAAGFKVSMEELEATVHQGLIGRPHIAEYLVSKNYVRTQQEAFDRYLAKDRPMYDEIEGALLDDAVSAITSSGGVPVTAHPLSLYTAWGRMGELFAYFAAKGILGIEAWHPAARPVECERLENLARKTGLIVTAGSDFHGGATRNERVLGYTSGGVPIGDRFWKDELEPLLLRAGT
ncbi:MAG: PHP domain-containing protein [Spirochaetaceae bacterium]|jgi:predicted metal-dependent phosphoesterase TrpH|nr:PHP domain-containing protein [Spirochaetaceae bacterium]